MVLTRAAAKAANVQASTKSVQETNRRTASANTVARQSTKAGRVVVAASVKKVDVCPTGSKKRRRDPANTDKDDSIVSFLTLNVTFNTTLKKKKPNRPPYSFPRKFLRTIQNKYKFVFGRSPIPDSFFRPPVSEFHEVFELIRADLEKTYGKTVENNPGVDENGPMHAATSASIHSLVVIILSQATVNDNAIRAGEALVKAYPYTVNGQTKTGKVPNYHAIRQDTHENLERVLTPGGLFQGRAKTIKELLDSVWAANESRLESLNGVELGQEPNAADFVPGMLSIDFLRGKSKTEILNWCCKHHGIGPKSASCLLAFVYRLPVLAVDTHVARIAKWLRWVPGDCSEKQAAMQLDVIVPDELKLGLHQAFWFHGQHCPPCKERGPSKADIEKGFPPCVLESRISNRLRKTKPASQKSPVKKAKSVPKKAPTWVKWENMTSEQAAAKGYVEACIDINPDYGSGAAITGQLRYWLKPSPSGVDNVPAEAVIEGLMEEESVGEDAVKGMVDEVSEDEDLMEGVVEAGSGSDEEVEEAAEDDSVSDEESQDVLEEDSGSDEEVEDAVEEASAGDEMEGVIEEGS